MPAERDDAIREAEQLDAERLTGILTRSGLLRRGRVAAVAVEPLGGTVAHVHRVRIVYTPDAEGALPATLALKISDSPRFGRSEIDYYTRDYAGLPGMPQPRCYDAAIAPDGYHYHLVLEDLSATHRNNFEVRPSLTFAVTVADALAALHAVHWGDRGVHAAGATLPGPAEVERYTSRSGFGLTRLLTDQRGEVDEDWLPLLRRLSEKHPAAMVARTADPAGFTLVHGDPNPGNILSPIDGSGPTYLIDRQPFAWSLTTWLAVSDIAYVVGHWMEPRERHELEQPMLRAYHAGLLRRGVEDYGWEQLWRDYRLCIPQSVYVATVWCAFEETRRSMAWLWPGHLRRAVAAVQELRCEEFWN